jgi:hypothetical protein
VKKTDYRRLLVVSGLTALVFSYAILWLRMINSSTERTGADFIAYYSAGRVAQTDGFTRVYEPDLQQDVQEGLVGFPLFPGQVLLYNHVPYLLPILFVFVSQNYIASFSRWATFLLVLFITGIVFVARMLRSQAWDKLEIWKVAAGMLTFFPLFVSLMNGQDTAFATLGLCLWCAGILSERDGMAGLGLALTTVRPHLAIFLAVPFLFRRWKVFGWFCLGAAGLGLASLLAVGWSGVRGFLDLLLVSTRGQWYGLKEPEMLDLVGLLWRAAPGLGGETIRWIGWAGYGLGLLGLCLLWARSRALSGKHLCLAITLAVFTAPHLHYHDLTWLLVALVLVMLDLVRSRLLLEQSAALLPLGVSWVLLLSGSNAFLHHAMPYLLMLALILFSWYPRLFFRRLRTPDGSQH